MFHNPARVLRSDMELLTASLLQRKVSVWERVESALHPIVSDAVIESVSPTAVRIGEHYFSRSSCIFVTELSDAERPGG